MKTKHGGTMTMPEGLCQRWLLRVAGLSPLLLPLWPFLGFLFSVFICGGFCNWAWIKIATVAPVTISTLSMLMIPVVGVFSGMLVLSERPQWTDYAALVLVIAALASVLIPPRAAAQAGKAGV